MFTDLGAASDSVCALPAQCYVDRISSCSMKQPGPFDVEREHAILERYGRCSSNVFCRSRKKSCSSGGCFKKSLPWHVNRHWLVCLLNELYVLQDIGTQTVSVRTS